MEYTDANQRLIDAIFPKILLSPKEIEKKYPQRILKEGMMVTRISPSPTGPMHIGGMYTALISKRLASQSDGIFYVRIEDTDKKREVQGSLKLIIESLARYGLTTDEGLQVSGAEIGIYGPYTQSERVHIYKPFIRMLLAQGNAYPCFCTQEQLEEMRAQQDLSHIRSGYYGSWATCRTRSIDEAFKRITDDIPFVIRFKSQGNFENKIIVQDLIKGRRELSQNDQDIVIMKSDGLPTYHFAHLIDDHFMGTTHVFRGDEWFPSVPLHLQLFETIGWQPPAYGHLMPIQKIDDGSKRKLSKRHDPEATISYYSEMGYPEQAVIDYLLNLANSNFEEWRKANPRTDNREFLLSIERLAKSGGPLLDLTKLEHVSKETIAHMTADEVYNTSLAWARVHDEKFASRMMTNEEYTKKIFGIERHEGPKARKDIGMWSQVKQEIAYFFDEEFHVDIKDLWNLLGIVDKNDVKGIISDFLKSYDPLDPKEQWLEKLRFLCERHGYAGIIKDFKQNPEQYKGTIIDVTKIFRVFLTGRLDTPDLFELMHVMGYDRITKRLFT